MHNYNSKDSLKRYFHRFYQTFEGNSVYHYTKYISVVLELKTGFFKVYCSSSLHQTIWTNIIKTNGIKKLAIYCILSVDIKSKYIIVFLAHNIPMKHKFCVFKNHKICTNVCDRINWQMLFYTLGLDYVIYCAYNTSLKIQARWNTILVFINIRYIYAI